MNADSVYDRRAWNAYNAAPPWQSNEERLCGEALAANANMSSDQIASIRPPIPRVGLFPPKFGYRQDAIGIRDIVQIDNVFPGARVDYSGSTSGYSGTSYPSLNQF